MRPVNLLPVKYRPRSGGGEDSKSSYIVLGALGALVLAVFVYVSTANQLSSRNAEIAKTRQEVQAAETQAVTLQSFGDFAGTKQARVAAVRDLATTRLDWERLFRELAHVLPERVWLTNFDGSVSGSSGGDAATTGTGAEGAGGPSVKLTGCAASYSGVADVMVRLRELHGADDVELTKSSKSEGGAEAGAAAEPAAAAGDCGPYYEFDVAVKLSLAEAVVTDASGQAAEVPARLGGGG